MEKAMAPHSSTPAWKIPWTEEPGGLQSMGSLRVRHDWATSLSLFTFLHWRRKWQPSPVFLPGESQGWRSLVGCRLWGRTESDTTEVSKQCCFKILNKKIQYSIFPSFMPFLMFSISLCRFEFLFSIIFFVLEELALKWSEVAQLRPHGLYVAHQAPLSMEFSRQEYWSGLPFPSPGDLPYPGIEPRSPALQADALPSEPPGNQELALGLV